MVRPHKAYTIPDMIKMGKGIELTYTKMSTHDFVEDIEFINEQILYRYKDYLMQFMATVVLDDNEFFKYQFNPKLLSHDIYGTQDLYFVILIANELISEKEFNLKRFKIIPPKSMNTIHAILNREKKYLTNNFHIRKSTPPESYSFDKKSKIASGGDSLVINKINELEIDLEKIKDEIRDAIGDKVNIDFDGLLSERIERELENIRNQIQLIIDSMITDVDDRITELETNITNITIVLEELMDRKLKDQLEYVLAKIDNLDVRHSLEITNIKITIEELRKDIDKILSMNIQDMIDNIYKNMEELYLIANSKTRDVAFQMFEPIEHGVQEDTEFHIPYRGIIEGATMSVRLDSMKDSNIIVIIQRSNEYGIWEEVGRLNLFVDLYYDDFTDLNIPIDRQSVRFLIHAGHVTNIRGMSIVLNVREIETYGDDDSEENQDEE